MVMVGFWPSDTKGCGQDLYYFILFTYVFGKTLEDCQRYKEMIYSVPCPLLGSFRSFLVVLARGRAPGHQLHRGFPHSSSALSAKSSSSSFS